MNGKSTVLIGLQYGDEGKARVMDYLLEGYDWVYRFNGGANAGHTLEVNGDRISLHQVPSGIFYPEMKLWVGSGTVVNPVKMVDEINEIESLGIDVRDRLYISPKASLVLPHHIVLDELTGKGVGTTGNGIGPAYAAQALRSLNGVLHHIQVGTYLANQNSNRRVVQQHLLGLCEKHDLELDVRELVEDFDRSMMSLEVMISSDYMQMVRCVGQGSAAMGEGANAHMLDRIYGLVPFVTSSQTLAAAAYTGGDMSLRYHDKTIGVAKAIMSRVGNGPFVSEFGRDRSEAYCKEGGGYKYVKEVEDGLYDPLEMLASEDELDVGIGFRMRSAEYGATTKRPRRIGMLDLVMLKQNCELNGVDELYINKVDCLVDYSKTKYGAIPLVVAYELDGERIEYMPSTLEELGRCTPVVEYVDAFDEDLTEVRNKMDLPREVHSLVDTVQEYTGVRIAGVGVGPQREQFVML